MDSTNIFPRQVGSKEEIDRGLQRRPVNHVHCEPPSLKRRSCSPKEMKTQVSSKRADAPYPDEMIGHHTKNGTLKQYMATLSFPVKNSVPEHVSKDPPAKRPKSMGSKEALLQEPSPRKPSLQEPSLRKPLPQNPSLQKPSLQASFLRGSLLRDPLFDSWLCDDSLVTADGEYVDWDSLSSW